MALYRWLKYTNVSGSMKPSEELENSCFASSRSIPTLLARGSSQLLEVSLLSPKLLLDHYNWQQNPVFPPPGSPPSCL